MFAHRIAQGIEGQKLDARVDRQGQVGAVLRLATRADLLDEAPEVVLDDAPGARLAGEPLLLCQLEAFLADILDIREPDDMSDGFAFGIVPLELVALIDAADVQRRDPGSDIRVDLTLEIDVVLVFGQLAVELAPIHRQQLCQLVELFAGRIDIFGVRPDRLGRQA